MWCTLFLFIRLICHAPRLGGYFELSLADIIAPQYRLPCPFKRLQISQELPLKSVGGREKVSLSFMCVIAPIEPLIGLMIAFYRSGCAVFRLYKRTLQHPSWRCPLCCFAFQPHKMCTQNTVYLVVKVQYCMRLKVYLTNQDKNKVKVRGR